MMIYAVVSLTKREDRDGKERDELYVHGAWKDEAAARRYVEKQMRRPSADAMYVCKAYLVVEDKTPPVKFTPVKE